MAGMSRIPRTLLILVLTAAASCAAAGEVAHALLEEFRLHGYSSPLVALQRLRATPEPGASAPLDLRWRYLAALATYAIRMSDRAEAQHALAALTQMAEREGCTPCRVQLLLRAAQRAELEGDMPRLRKLLAQLAALPTPADAQLRFEQLAMLSSGSTTLGEYDASIEAAVKADEVALATDRPADHVAAFDLLVRANASRRDMPRAVALAREGYPLAERIGFTYVMVLLRGNEAYALSAAKEADPRPRRTALYETLRLSRMAPGLDHVENVTLTNIAAFHNDQREYETALRFASEGEALARKRGNEVGRALAIVNRGVALVHLGQTEGGLALVRESVSIVEKNNLKRETAELVAQLADVCEYAGRPTEAMQALRRLVKLNEQVTSSQREQAVLALQEKHSAERKTREIERLQLENAKRDAELVARTSQQRLWAAVAVALTLAALMLAQWLGRARRHARALEVDNAKLSEASSQDALTGAFNRRYFEALMAGHARQAHGPVGLMLVDVDFFKIVNDTHGHAVGDQVLVEVARRLQCLVREHDAVVRWGGEEFVLVLPGTSREALPMVAERVLSAIGLDAVELENGEPLQVQASGGAVAWPMWPGQHWEQALQVADMALYLSKSGGRNRATCVASIAEPAPVELLCSDLRAAHQGGHVVLQSVLGPVVLQHGACTRALP